MYDDAKVCAGNKSMDNTQRYLVNAYIDEGRFEDLMNLIYHDLSVRKMLTRVFIRESYAMNYELYAKKEDTHDNTLGNMLSILYFQNSLNLRAAKKKK